MIALFSLFLVWISWRKPSISLAILLQINIIRSVITIDINNICYGCLEDSHIFLGAILPILSMSIIIAKIYYKKQNVKYKIDDFDYFILGLVFTSFIGIFISDNLINSLLFWLKLVLLGISFFFVSKLFFYNTKNIRKEFSLFFRTTLNLALILGILSLFFVMYSGKSIWRMTMPGTHPIPYAILMGFASLIYTYSFFDRSILGKRKFLFHISGILSIVLLIMSQTKGVIIAAFISLIFFMIGFGLKISMKWIKNLSLGILFIIPFFLYYFDFSVIFQRINEFGSAKDQSTNERIQIYFDSFSIIYDNPILGVGTDGFQYHSFGSYPHNLFLELITNYGVLGFILTIYFLLIISFVGLKTWGINNSNILSKIIASLLIFFFIETMFSFTLWMHKGLYLSMAMYSVYYHYNKKNGIT